MPGQTGPEGPSRKGLLILQTSIVLRIAPAVPHCGLSVPVFYAEQNFFGPAVSNTEDEFVPHGLWDDFPRAPIVCPTCKQNLTLHRQKSADAAGRFGLCFYLPSTSKEYP